METQMPSRLTIALDRRYLLFKRFLFNLKCKLTHNNRPGSSPYISGDTFREMADHIHDETTNFQPNLVTKGDIVFVSNDMMLNYMKQIHPQINSPYILICHNSDGSIGKEIADLLDDKIIRLYAQDAVYLNNKMVPIPIGLENLHYYSSGIFSDIDKLRRKISKRSPIRKNRIFFKFNVRTNPAERGPALEYFTRHPLMETTSYKISPTLHSRKLTTYKFVASPPGHAIESCRTWEGLYLKTVPIVKDFVSMRYFKSLGLPLWIVKDWNELDGVTEEQLARKYDELIKGASWEALNMDFWSKQILSDRNKAKNIK